VTTPTTDGSPWDTNQIIAGLYSRIRDLGGWAKENEVAQGKASSDCINSWWCNVRSLYDEMRDRVYFTGVSRGGLMHIGIFDRRRNTVQRFPLWAFEADDHNTPAMLIPENKPPIVIGTRHDMDNVVRMKIGTSPHELSTLGETVELDFGRSVSYAQIMWDRANQLAVFARAADGWYCKRSTDYGKTWGPAFRFYGLGYGTFRQVGFTIYYAATTHPTSVPNNAIRCFKINIVSGEITNYAGTVIDNLWTMTSVIAGNSMTYARQSYDTDAGHNTNRVFDVGVDGSVLAMRFHKDNPGAGGMIGVYRAKNTGAAPSSSQPVDDPNRGWTFEPIIHSGVPALYYVSSYVGGAQFAGDANSVWIAHEKNGTWTLEKFVKTGSTWSSAEVRLVRNDGRKLARPQVPLGGESKGLVLVGDYHHTVPENYWDFYADQLLTEPAA